MISTHAVVQQCQLWQGVMAHAASLACLCMTQLSTYTQQPVPITNYLVTAPLADAFVVLTFVSIGCCLARSTLGDSNQQQRVTQL